MYVGYARISTKDQSLAVQIAKLQEAHCEEIFQDVQSGAKDDRPQLQQCLTFVRRGDTLCVTRLDRLARSTMHLCALAKELKRKEVELHVLDQAIDTTTPTGMLTFHILSAIAEFERALLMERQREGILHAKAKGVHFGRKKLLTPAQVQTLREERARGDIVSVLWRRYGLKTAAIYRYLKRPPLGGAEARRIREEGTLCATAPPPTVSPSNAKAVASASPMARKCGGPVRVPSVL